jgi:hypothetical protein
VFSDGKTNSASVVDVRWGGVNLAVVQWESVKVLGDEFYACHSDEYPFLPELKYQDAVRANRQLSVSLRVAQAAKAFEVPLFVRS